LPEALSYSAIVVMQDGRSFEKRGSDVYGKSSAQQHLDVEGLRAERVIY
jgi:hypothetical protein